MSIEKITVHNFQCHKDLSLELGRVTTIVGPSDSGKSALMRALDWVCFNRGRVALLTRRGEKDTSVTITIDGHEVTRTTSNNAYIVDGVELGCIGRTIPAEVVSLFRMTEDNLQRQHDYLFWFSVKGGELTRNFNRIVDLTKLDEWVRAGSSIERSFHEKVKYCVTRMGELLDEERHLIPFEKMAIVFDGLKLLFTEIGTKRNRLTGVINLLTDISNNNRNLQFLTDYKTELSGLLDLGSRYFDGTTRLTDIKNALRLVARVEKGTEYRNDLRKLACCYYDGLTAISRRDSLNAIISVLNIEIPNITKYRELLRSLETAIRRMVGISRLIDQIGEIESNIVATRRHLNELKTELTTKLDGVCPICGRTLGTETEFGGHE